MQIRSSQKSMIPQAKSQVKKSPAGQSELSLNPALYRAGDWSSLGESQASIGDTEDLVKLTKRLSSNSEMKAQYTVTTRTGERPLTTKERDDIYAEASTPVMAFGGLCLGAVLTGLSAATQVLGDSGGAIALSIAPLLALPLLGFGLDAKRLEKKYAKMDPEIAEMRRPLMETIKVAGTVSRADGETWFQPNGQQEKVHIAEPASHW